MYRLHVSALAEIACDEAVGTGSSLHLVTLVILVSVFTYQLQQQCVRYISGHEYRWTSIPYCSMRTHPPYSPLMRIRRESIHENTLPASSRQNTKQ